MATGLRGLGVRFEAKMQERILQVEMRLPLRLLVTRGPSSWRGIGEGRWPRQTLRLWWRQDRAVEGEGHLAWCSYCL